MRKSNFVGNLQDSVALKDALADVRHLRHTFHASVGSGSACSGASSSPFSSTFASSFCVLTGAPGPSVTWLWAMAGAEVGRGLRSVDSAAAAMWEKEGRWRHVSLSWPSVTGWNCESCSYHIERRQTWTISAFQGSWWQQEKGFLNRETRTFQWLLHKCWIWGQNEERKQNQSVDSGWLSR